MFDIHPIMLPDSYKFSQWLQYPKDLSYSFAYIESRGGMYDRTIFFGLQYILKNYFERPIASSDIDEAEIEARLQGLPFNRSGWEYILSEHKGFMPVKIKAVKEGMIIPNHIPLVTIESTDENVPWIVGWLEDILLQVWYPITVASRAFKNKQTIWKYVQETSDFPESIDWKLHDFGLRASTSIESAMIGGAAHNTCFLGTDTVIANRLLRKFYKGGTGFLNGSVPATEHSTITSWGKENEKAAYENFLDVFLNPESKYKVDMASCVSDSYNIFDALENIWGEDLKDKIISYGGKLIARPDSGDPLYSVLDCLSTFESKFGSVENNKKFKVLNYTSAIQGDGVDDETIEEILSYMKAKRFSTDNICFGMGGYLHQKLNRDTQKTAYKWSAIGLTDKDQIVPIGKSPIMDSDKTSKQGIVDSVFDEYGYRAIKRERNEIPNNSILNVVYENGKVFSNESIFDIRNLVNQEIGV